MTWEAAEESGEPRLRTWLCDGMQTGLEWEDLSVFTLQPAGPNTKHPCQLQRAERTVTSHCTALDWSHHTL